MKKSYFAPSKLSAACLASMLILNGCGSDVQDQGVISQSNQVFSGRAIDGYIARATVFIDSNNNGTRDAWEAWASAVSSNRNSTPQAWSRSPLQRSVGVVR